MKARGLQGSEAAMSRSWQSESPLAYHQPPLTRDSGHSISRSVTWPSIRFSRLSGRAIPHETFRRHNRHRFNPREPGGKALAKLEEWPTRVSIQSNPEHCKRSLGNPADPVEPPRPKMSEFLLHWYQLDPPVLRTTVCGAVTSDKVCFAEAMRSQLSCWNTLFCQIVHDCISAPLGQLHIVGVASDGIAVAIDVNPRVGTGLDTLGRFIEDRLILGPNCRLIEGKMDTSENHFLLRNRWRRRRRRRWRLADGISG